MQALIFTASKQMIDENKNIWDICELLVAAQAALALYTTLLVTRSSSR